MNYQEIRRKAFLMLQNDLRPHFMERVLNDGVATDVRSTISEEKRKAISKGTAIDTRVPWMMSVSGKGGPGYPDHVNVTLLDHCLSVAFGAAYLSLADALAEGVSERRAIEIAAVVMAVGFSHDVDKYYGKPWQEIDEHNMQAFCATFHLLPWLDLYGATLTAEGLYQLVKSVEVRSFENHFSVDRAYVQACRSYVRFADALESKFLTGQPYDAVANVRNHWEKGLKNHLRCPQVFGGYREIVLFDPHHHFLLDEFAGCVYEASKHVDGAPPLIHVVHDGTFVALVPSDSYDEIVSLSIEDLVRHLDFDTSLFINPTGNVKVIGRKPDFEAIEDVVTNQISTGNASALFLVKTTDLKNHRVHFQDLIASLDVIADLEVPKQGKQKPIIQCADDRTCNELALLSLAIGLDEYSKSKELTKERRMEALIGAISSSTPEWFSDIDKLSRRTATTLWAYNACQASPDIHERVFGDGGLISTWFGEEGVLQGMPEEADRICADIKQWFETLLAGHGVSGDDQQGGRCLVTGMPVDGKRVIKGTDAVYGIKSSAISYREGRPEYRTKEQAGTHLSSISLAEYKFRKGVYEAHTSRREGGIPILVSSSLFGGLFRLCHPHTTNLSELNSRELNIYDMARSEVKKGIVFRNLDTYMQKTRIARFEELSNKFIEQVSFLRLILLAARRSGRPIHIFRGLPTWQKDFFYADFLSQDLKYVMGGSGLRLEEIDGVLNFLSVIEFVGNPPSAKGNPGLGMATLAKGLCNPAERFQSACLIWDTMEEKELHNSHKNLIANLIEEEIAKMGPDNSNHSLVRLGQVARKIQRRWIKDDSNKEKEFLLRKAIEAATECYRIGIKSRENMIIEIAGYLRDEADSRHVGRSSFYAAPENRPKDRTLDTSIEEFATEFVDNLWNGRFKGSPPSARNVQFAVAAYKFAFLKASTGSSEDS